MRNGILILVLTLFPLVAFAQMYKWVDENGRTQFSDRPPPPGVKYTVINAPVPEPNKPVATPKSITQQEIEFRRRRVKEAEEEKKEQENKKKAELLAEECDRAQQRLRNLNDPAPIFSVNKDGGRDYMSAETREAEKQKAKQDVERTCK
jgi:hypothetical protein